MSGAKPRTPPYISHQMYGEVPEKYATPYFAKVLMAGNKTVIYSPKYVGNLHGKRDM